MCIRRRPGPGVSPLTPHWHGAHTQLLPARLCMKYKILNIGVFRYQRWSVKHKILRRMSILIKCVGVIPTTPPCIPLSHGLLGFSDTEKRSTVKKTFKGYLVNFVMAPAGVLFSCKSSLFELVTFQLSVS